jgi:hypothetical protein
MDGFIPQFDGETEQLDCKTCDQNCKSCTESVIKCMSCYENENKYLDETSFKCLCNDGFYLEKDNSTEKDYCLRKLTN